MTVVLVINSGSSSFKYQLVDVESQTALASGLVERIGQESGSARHTVGDADHSRELPIPDHTAGVRVMLAGGRVEHDFTDAAIQAAMSRLRSPALTTMVFGTEK